MSETRLSLLRAVPYPGLPPWIAVEIGVANGNYSLAILKYTDYDRVYSVDHWGKDTEDEYLYEDINSVDEQENEKRFKTASERLQVYGERSFILRETSRQAAGHFAPQSLSFVYIDANHRFEAVMEDIKLWWPKIRPGGMLAGHDYLDGRRGGTLFGVKSAVDQFFREARREIKVTNEKFPTWYVLK